MGIFTKLFVLLVAVASVLLVGLLVPFVVNSSQYKTRYQDEVARRIVAEANAANAEADKAAQSQADQNQIAALRGEITNLQGLLAERDNRAAGLNRQVIQLQNANDDVRNQLATLSGAQSQSAQTISLLEKEVTERRNENIELRTRNIEVNDRNQELETSNGTLTRNVRFLQETNADLLAENERLAQTLASMPAGSGSGDAVASDGFNASHPILGRVTNVGVINGETVVALNVGRNDAVAEGMKFLIHRDGRFLGNAIITLVDDNESSGRVTLQGAGAAIQANDEAWAGTN